MRLVHFHEANAWICGGILKPSWGYKPRNMTGGAFLYVTFRDIHLSQPILSVFKRQQILWKSRETQGLRHSLHRSQKNIAGRRRWIISLRFACYKIITQLGGIELFSFPVFWGSSQQKGSSKTTNRSPSSLSDRVAIIPPILAGSVSAFLGISLQNHQFPLLFAKKKFHQIFNKKHCFFCENCCFFVLNCWSLIKPPIFAVFGRSFGKTTTTTTNTADFSSQGADSGPPSVLGSSQPLAREWWFGRGNYPKMILVQVSEVL